MLVLKQSKRKKRYGNKLPNVFFFFNFKELEDNKVLEKERERWE